MLPAGQLAPLLNSEFWAIPRQSLGFATLRLRRRALQPSSLKKDEEKPSVPHTKLGHFAPNFKVEHSFQRQSLLAFGKIFHVLETIQGPGPPDPSNLLSRVALLRNLDCLRPYLKNILTAQNFI
jgi:hypothetical protein